MKKRIFLIGIVFAFFALAAISACKNPANPVYELSPPVINGDFNADYNEIYWKPVEGADYYRVYGLQFVYDAKNLEGSIPRDKKKFKEIGATRELSFRHNTKDDWAYAVRAFSDGGKKSDFSLGEIFTEYWPK